eukprot:3174207-Rhodomonas_salina.1
MVDLWHHARSQEQRRVDICPPDPMPAARRHQMTTTTMMTTSRSTRSTRTTIGRAPRPCECGLETGITWCLRPCSGLTATKHAAPSPRCLGSNCSIVLRHRTSR